MRFAQYNPRIVRIRGLHITYTETKLLATGGGGLIPYWLVKSLYRILTPTYALASTSAATASDVITVIMQQPGDIF